MEHLPHLQKLTRTSPVYASTHIYSTKDRATPGCGFVFIAEVNLTGQSPATKSLRFIIVGNELERKQVKNRIYYLGPKNDYGAQ